MSNLNEIQARHGWDRWKDALFIAAAVVMTALALGAVSSQAAGDPPTRHYELTVIESNVEIDNR